MSQTKLFTIVIVQPKKANIDKMEHCQQCCVDGAIIEWSFRIKKLIRAIRKTNTTTLFGYLINTYSHVTIFDRIIAF